jgi:hypothetical protein
MVALEMIQSNCNEFDRSIRFLQYSISSYGKAVDFVKRTYRNGKLDNYFGGLYRWL